MIQKLPIESVVELYYGGPLKGSTDSSSGLRIVRPADLDPSRGADAHYVTEYNDLAHMRRLQEGDIVVALAGPIGRSMVVEGDLVGAVLGRWCAAICARPDQTAVTNNWLHAWTQSSDFKQQVEVWTMPATMPRLPEPALRSFLVPVPDEDGRIHLESLVAAFDSAIDDLERTLRLTRDLRTLEIDLLVSNE